MSQWQAMKQDFLRKQNNYVLVKRIYNRYVKLLMQFGTLSVIHYRLGRAGLENRFWPFKLLLLGLYWLLWPLNQRIAGIRLTIATPIGPGLAIHNFSNIYVRADEIGENLTLNQDAIIGPDWRNQGLPKLGSNVYLGCGAKILGPVQIGDNVVVAANALVVRDVPSNCMVAGVPGMVIVRNLDPDYLSSVPAHRR